LPNSSQHQRQVEDNNPIPVMTTLRAVVGTDEAEEA